MSSEERSTFCFADFEADAAQLELRRSGRRVPIQLKPLRLLLYLLAARNRAVRKEELLEEVWQGVVVGESVLSTTIRDLRRALGDAAPSRSAIRTVRGYGYRFAAPVRVLAPSDPSDRSVCPAAPPGWRIDLEEREAELSSLLRALEAVRGGAGRARVLVGAAGSGKTSVLRRALEDAASAGFSVHLARAYEAASASPFWVWTDLLGSISTTFGAKVFDRWLASDAPFLRELIAGTPDRAQSSPLEVLLTSEQGRVRLEGAIWRVVCRAAREQPLLIACEDLHLSDPASLRVLEFALDRLAEVQVLVVATLGETGVVDPRGIKRLLGVVARNACCQRLTLADLSRSAVGRLIGRAIGGEVPDALVTKVHTATSGNPFFVSEIAELLATSADPEGLVDGSAEIPLPESVRDAVTSRLAATSQGCHALLSVAAVVGPEFDAALLSEATGTPGDEVSRHLAEAERARFVGACANRPGRHAFDRSIVRDVLYSALSEAERQRIHGRVGVALEKLSDGSDPELVSELARHFRAAGPGDLAEEAMRLARSAAERCGRMFAWVEAERHCREGLKIARASGARDHEFELLILRAKMLILGGPEIGREAHGEAERSLSLAGELAHQIADRTAIARCTSLRAELELGRTFPLAGLMPPGLLGHELMDDLERAIADLGDDRGPLRVQLMRQLSKLHYQSGSVDRAEALCEQMKQICEANGLEEELVRTEILKWERMGADRVAEKETILEWLESFALARESADVAARVASFRASLELERANVEGAMRAIDQHRKVLGELQIQTAAPDVFDAMRFTLQGRFEEAERSAARVLGINARLSLPNIYALLMDGALRRGLAYARGEPEHDLALLRTVAAGTEAILPRVVFVHTLTQCDLRAEAESVFDELELDAVPRDSHWLTMMSMLGETSAYLQRRDASERLYDLLLPYSELAAVQGWFALCLGSVSRPLALLAASLGRDEAARQHFERALAVNTRMEARPWVCRCQLEYADFLARRGPADRARACALLAAAQETAEALDIRSFEERARSLSIELLHSQAPREP